MSPSITPDVVAHGGRGAMPDRGRRPRRWFAPEAALIAALAAGPARAEPAAPVGTLAALGRALTACFRAPEGSAGSQITVLLSLRRDGAVLGRPRITYTHLVGTPADRQAFVAAALGGLQACTPVAVTATLGAAVAGRPFSVRFVGGPPPQRV